MIVMRSFSKIFGLAGLRVGYAISDPEVARLLDIVQEPFNVNRAALAAGIAGSPTRASSSGGAPRWPPRARCSIAELGRPASRATRRTPNFVLVELGADDVAVCDALMRRGMLVRAGTEFGLPGFVRVTVAPEAGHATCRRRDRGRRSAI